MSWLKKLGTIVTSKSVWINLLIVVVLFVVLVFATLQYLKSYTDHGESVTVPTLIGMQLEEAQEFVADKSIHLFVMDSIYNPELKPGEIINQNPATGSKVKEDRRVYLTIRSYKAEEAAIPDVEGISLRNAISKLKNAGFDVGDRIYRPYKYTNAVLHVSLDDKKVNPGMTFPKGTTFDLVVGNGLGDTRVMVPNLIGNTLEEAEFILLGGYNLNIGVADYDSTSVLNKRDTLEAVIFQQNPEPEEELRIGEFVDVQLMNKVKFEALMDSMINAPIDSLALDTLDNR